MERSAGLLATAAIRKIPQDNLSLAWHDGYFKLGAASPPSIGTKKNEPVY
jgi:hypothetical protein